MRTNRAGCALRALAVALALFASPACAAADGPIPAGPARTEMVAGRQVLQVWTYKPASFRGDGVLLVFHGVGRNAASYRDHARPLADALGLLVVAPLFDRSRFPAWKYQRGGLVYAAGDQEARDPEPRATWTTALVADLLAAVRAREARPGLRAWLIGHSGGGQFLSRTAAVESPDVVRIVVANPGTWMMPTADERVPYGFAGLPDPPGETTALRRYLAAPLTVYLGTADTGEADLSQASPALRHGDTRYARGLAAFRMAEATARRNGWPFGWCLVEARGIGHSARRMFAAPAALRALRPGPSCVESAG